MRTRLRRVANRGPRSWGHGPARDHRRRPAFRRGQLSGASDVGRDRSARDIGRALLSCGARDCRSLHLRRTGTPAGELPALPGLNSGRRRVQRCSACRQQRPPPDREGSRADGRGERGFDAAATTAGAARSCWTWRCQGRSSSPAAAAPTPDPPTRPPRPADRHQQVVVELPLPGQHQINRERLLPDVPVLTQLQGQVNRHAIRCRSPVAIPLTDQIGACACPSSSFRPATPTSTTSPSAPRSPRPAHPAPGRSSAPSRCPAPLTGRVQTSLRRLISRGRLGLLRRREHPALERSCHRNTQRTLHPAPRNRGTALKLCRPDLLACTFRSLARQRTWTGRWLARTSQTRNDATNTPGHGVPPRVPTSGRDIDPTHVRRDLPRSASLQQISRRAARSVRVIRGYNSILVQSQPLRQMSDAEAESSLRVLTDSNGAIEPCTIGVTESFGKSMEMTEDCSL